MLRVILALSVVCGGLDVGSAALAADEAGSGGSLVLHLRARQLAAPQNAPPEQPSTGQQGPEQQDPAQARQPDFQIVHKLVAWEPAKTAVLMLGMWDRHPSPEAQARIAAMAPRAAEFVSAARSQGALVVHVPYGRAAAYEGTPQRQLAERAPATKDPRPLSEEQIDRRELPPPWEPAPVVKPAAGTRQHPAIEPQSGDAITDSGAELGNLLAARGIDHLILLGADADGSMLSAWVGVKNLLASGRDVVVVRDLVDIAPRSDEPAAEHHARRDQWARYLERLGCASITSDQLLKDAVFAFPDDRRPHIVFLVNEDEYFANETMPPLAELLEDRLGHRVTYVTGVAEHDLTGVQAIRTADTVVMFLRRRALPKDQLGELRRYFERGGSLVALRTSSHALALRKGEPPAGSEQWPTFDVDVLGCRYGNHAGNDLGSAISAGPAAESHPIMKGLDTSPWHSTGSLYKSDLVDADAQVLLRGKAKDWDEPVAWTRLHNGGRIFYTSLGHRDDLARPDFVEMLVRAVQWTMGPEAKLSE
ncbi:MAG: isochorismatase family protein [Planctomycetota bacterium]